VAGEERRRVAELRPLRRSDPPFTGAGAAVPATHARDAIWVRPRLVGLVEFTGFTADGRLRLPRWRGSVEPNPVDEPRWARPTDPPPRRAAPPAPGSAPDRAAAARPQAPEPEPASDGVRERRLEQHFFYNSLNTIGALIRTDPTRARELLFGFADVSRSADLPEDSTSTLARELDAVRGYLQLEQARFGKRLRVRLEVDPAAEALDGVAVRPLQVLAAVRSVVQDEIEPRPDGGELTVSVRLDADGCRVGVHGPDGPPAMIVLPASGAALPG
jgi:hypothetical protein